MLAKQKLEDFEDQCKTCISRAFQSAGATRASDEWIAADMIMNLNQRNSEHTKYGFPSESVP